MKHWSLFAVGRIILPVVKQELYCNSVESVVYMLHWCAKRIKLEL